MVQGIQCLGPLPDMSMIEKQCGWISRVKTKLTRGKSKKVNSCIFFMPSVQVTSHLFLFWNDFGAKIEKSYFQTKYCNPALLSFMLSIQFRAV